jgi:hypothetical protein
LPLALSGEFRTFLGQTVVGAAPTLLPFDATLHLGHAIAIGETVVVVGQLGMQSALSSPVRTAAIGALLQPFEQLVLAPSVARIDDQEASVAFGGTLLRGFSSQPLIEVEVVDGLFIYENTFVLCGLSEKGLSLRAHSHVMGVMLYF